MDYVFIAAWGVMIIYAFGALFHFIGAFGLIRAKYSGWWFLLLPVAVVMSIFWPIWMLTSVMRVN